MLNLDPKRDTWHTTLGKRLRARRGSLSRYKASDIVSRTVIARLEAGTNTAVSLSTLYLLSLRYGVNLGQLLQAGEDPGPGSWPADAPSLSETSDVVRTRLRELREAKNMGAKKLCAATQDPSVRFCWLLRLEHGRMAVIDMARVAKLMHAMDLPIWAVLPDAFHP